MASKTVLNWLSKSRTHFLLRPSLLRIIIPRISSQCNYAGIYLRSKAARDAAAKSTASTMVILKMAFSKPRLVWYPAFQLSAPPNTPPALASDFCIKIAAVKSTASTICIYGRNLIKVVIKQHYSKKR